MRYLTSVVAFLEMLEPAERAELEELFQPVGYDPGETLFEQGDRSEGAFIVEVGEIELSMELPGGGRVPVVRLGPGSFIGELAWLQAMTRTLSATAVGPVRAQYVDAVDFRALLSSFRPSAYHLLKEVTRLVSERVYATQEAAMELWRGMPPSRAAEPEREFDARPMPSSFDCRPYLGAFPLFASFTRRDIEDLIERASVLEAPKGTTLQRAGQSDPPCWIVVYGALESICPRSRVRMAVLGPGSAHGHIERLLRRETQMDLRVREPAIVLRLAPETCEDLMRPTSRLPFRMMHGLGILTVGALEHANRVVARERRMYR
jgi:CRP/FNR family cyclic AMP-dependent transcriptional regulator